MNKTRSENDNRNICRYAAAEMTSHPAVCVFRVNTRTKSKLATQAICKHL